MLILFFARSGAAEADTRYPGDYCRESQTGESNPPPPPPPSDECRLVTTPQRKPNKSSHELPLPTLTYLSPR